MVIHSHYSFLLNHCTYFTWTAWVSCTLTEQRRPTVLIHTTRKDWKPGFLTRSILCATDTAMSIQWGQPLQAGSDSWVWRSDWFRSNLLSDTVVQAVCGSIQTVAMTLEWRHRPAWFVVSDVIATDSGTCCSSCPAAWLKRSYLSRYSCFLLFPHDITAPHLQ